MSIENDHGIPDDISNEELFKLIAGDPAILDALRVARNLVQLNMTVKYKTERVLHRYLITENMWFDNLHVVKDRKAGPFNSLSVVRSYIDQRTQWHRGFQRMVQVEVLARDAEQIHEMGWPQVFSRANIKPFKFDAHGSNAFRISGLVSALNTPNFGVHEETVTFPILFKRKPEATQ